MARGQLWSLFWTGIQFLLAETAVYLTERRVTTFDLLYGAAVAVAGTGMFLILTSPRLWRRAQPDRQQAGPPTPGTLALVHGQEEPYSHSGYRDGDLWRSFRVGISVARTVTGVVVRIVRAVLIDKNNGTHFLPIAFPALFGDMPSSLRATDDPPPHDRSREGRTVNVGAPVLYDLVERNVSRSGVPFVGRVDADSGRSNQRGALTRGGRVWCIHVQATADGFEPVDRWFHIWTEERELRCEAATEHWNDDGEELDALIAEGVRIVERLKSRQAADKHRIRSVERTLQDDELPDFDTPDKWRAEAERLLTRIAPQELGPFRDAPAVGPQRRLEGGHTEDIWRKIKPMEAQLDVLRGVRRDLWPRQAAR